MLTKNPIFNKISLDFTACKMLEQLAIYVKSDKGDVEIPDELYDECKPRNIIRDLRLKEIDYYELAKYGHFR